MGRVCFLLLIIILNLSGATQLTSSPISIQEEGTLQEILARTKAAAGGAAWDQVRNMRIRWDAEEGGLKGTVDETDDLVTVRYADAWDFGVRSGAFGFDGKFVWSQDSSGLSQVEEGSDARHGATNEAYRRSLAYWYPERWRAQLEYKGREQVDDLQFLILKITPERGRPFELWFDSKTYLLARVVEMTATGQLQVFFSDYREIENVKVAFQVRVKLSSGNENVYRAQTIEFNSRVADSRFNKPGPPPADFLISRNASSVTLPMDLINNHIYVSGWLNGQGPFSFLVDTGWGTSSITPEVAIRLGLTVQGAQKTIGAGEGTAQNQFTKVARMRFGGVQLRNQSLLVTSAFDGKTRDAVNNFGGLIGYQLFKRFVVKVDFERKALTLIVPERFNRRGHGTIVPFKLSNTIPLVRAEVDGFEGEFIVDSGFPGSVILYQSFITKNNLLTKLKPKFEAVTGWGIGGPVRSGVTRAQIFKLGEESIPDSVVTLSLVRKGTLADAYLAGAIGSELLKRFTVTFDYGGREIHLERNGQFNKREVFDRSGMYLNKAPDWFEVVDVIKGGPADAAGVITGDRIVSIDGQKASALTMPEVRSRLRGPLQTRISLVLERGNSVHRAVLVLKDLV
ncbi:MAG TPA: aspartyl protease family protein [Pyrinomonadaceae bacterium]|nr:aspartyl protease family protein [Pyrinomonadaceae bacterium]